MTSPPGDIDYPSDCYVLVYSNTNHMLDEEAVKLLAHDQSLRGKHEAKNYVGLIYAVAEEGRIVWYEHVRFRYSIDDEGNIRTFKGSNLSKVIESVVDVYGY